VRVGQTSPVQKGMRGCCMSHRESSRWSFKHSLEQFVIGAEASIAVSWLRLENSMRAGVVVQRLYVNSEGARLEQRCFGVASALRLLGGAVAGTHRDADAGTRRRGPRAPWIRLRRRATGIHHRADLAEGLPPRALAKIRCRRVRPHRVSTAHHGRRGAASPRWTRLRECRRRASRR
jgi:hypothetical protein